MDFVQIAGSDMVKDGLCLMLDAASDGMSGILDGGKLVEVHTALLVIEVAKMADDRDEWFPCGKWATIQAIQCRCAEQLKTLFANDKHDGRL
jgi:hypothetical protein